MLFSFCEDYRRVIVNSSRIDFDTSAQW